MIDRIRHDIQQRLEQLLAEADKLRHALAALDPRERPNAQTENDVAADREAGCEEPRPSQAHAGADPNTHCQHGERR